MRQMQSKLAEVEGEIARAESLKASSVSDGEKVGNDQLQQFADRISALEAEIAGKLKEPLDSQEVLLLCAWHTPHAAAGCSHIRTAR